MNQKNKKSIISAENSKRIAQNTGMLYIRMLITMSVSLYTSRIVLNTLGIEDFGIYNLVGGVVTTFAFLKNAMTSATQRFLSFEIGKNNLDQLTKTFNASVLIHIGIAIIIGVLAETLGLWFLNNYLNIPDARMNATRWVFHFSVLTFMVSTIRIPYNSIIIARERMTVFAYVSILEVLLKLLIVFMLTWLTFDKLKLYSILIFVVAVVITLIYKVYTRIKFQETSFLLAKEKNLYSSLASFSGWSLLGNLALVSSNQGIAMIMNVFIGVVVNAAVGIANQVNTAIFGFISNFQLAFNPQLIKTYAANNLEEHRQLVYKTSKYSFFLLLMLVTPILFNTEYVLTLWLKIVPEYAILFTKLILIGSLIDALAGPFWMAAHAIGKIRRYQIMIALILMMNLPLSYTILHLGYSPKYVYVTIIVLNFITYIYRLFYVKPFIKISFYQLFKNVFFNILTVSFSSISLMYIIKRNFFTHNSILNLIVFSLISVSIMILFITILGSSKQERNYIINIILKRIY